MRTISIALAAAVWVLLPTGAVAFQNEPTGFRGIAWGTPLSSVQNQLRPVGATLAGQDQAYVRIRDNMTIGGAMLEKILYKFHDGVFSEAFIVSQKGPSNTGAMIAAFTAQFGEWTAASISRRLYLARSAEHYLFDLPQWSASVSCICAIHHSIDPAKRREGRSRGRRQEGFLI